MPISLECFACGSHFTLADELAGRTGKCTVCGAILDIPAPDGAGELQLADEPQLVEDPSDAARPTAISDPARRAGGDATVLNLAAGERPAPVYHGPNDAIQAPRRGFWADAGLSFIVHFRRYGPAVLITIFVLNVIMGFLSFAPFIGMVGQLFISAWLCAYYLNVIGETCRGEDDLPPLGLEDGLWDGLIRPYLLFLGSVLWVMLPVIIWGTALYFHGQVLGDAPDTALALGLTALGIFIWPMTILTIAIHGFSPTILRYDQQLVSIARALPQYLAIWLLLLINATGLFLASLFLYSRADLVLLIVLTLLLCAAEGYAMLAAMRIIGLFYRHNKRKFVWEAE